ncbi:RsmB/NOP family class I SAM-dependent RNA methyltransferase [Actibacterium lipolyticum]|uniref:Ribosomal RNA small subunit methyltransferase B n=1 Tax=Actibacterium lipolyticum TaxID=1524263 RepID=A0A238JYK4_9RHOB|nr:RsmB/NOP family class I SAM-dependent RNA methyltransferase [Actibacterium lipolyticum]SMX34786.1 Ribosomal RNA small subunit methyltransferase B [Actibacterium lipolyticum]
MTPAARVAAAIEILDDVLAGAAAEKQLTTWGRQNRFAGSKDRAAIRDLVFDALRCMRSYAALGGAETGRGLMIGALRAAGDDPAALFTGEGYSAAPLTEAEQALNVEMGGLPEAVALDCPDWLVKPLQNSLGADFADVMQLLRQRAPVFLRVNLRKCTVSEAQERLREEGIETTPSDISPTALRVETNPRRVQNSQPFLEGLVELQDAASQAITDHLEINEGARVLDYCAGGGGKTLAMAGRVTAEFYAHDANPQRMRDLPARAGRAGVHVVVLDTDEVADAAPFDVVLCDVPCSGSGAWRRSPEGKWRLDDAALQELVDLQSQIIDLAANFVAPGGLLAYATCSLLNAENDDQTDAFLARNAGWEAVSSLRFTPLDGGDGFFTKLFRRS